MPRPRSRPCRTNARPARARRLAAGAKCSHHQALWAVHLPLVALSRKALPAEHESRRPPTPSASASEPQRRYLELVCVRAERREASGVRRQDRQPVGCADFEAPYASSRVSGLAVGRSLRSRGVLSRNACPQASPSSTRQTSRATGTVGRARFASGRARTPRVDYRARIAQGGDARDVAGDSARAATAAKSLPCMSAHRLRN